MMKILYEDKNIVVFEKLPGVDCEKVTARELEGMDSAQKLYCVHRLDKGTGGVTALAKSSEAATLLMKEFQEGRVEKEYLALAEGIVEPPAGELHDFLFHDTKKNRSYVVKKERKGVREAVLTYEKMAQVSVDSCPCSLLRVHLITGRTHQIRVQFASRKHPLFGDRCYGSRHAAEGNGLWSAFMSFVSPGTGEKLTFTSLPPWEACKAVKIFQERSREAVGRADGLPEGSPAGCNDWIAARQACREERS